MSEKGGVWGRRAQGRCSWHASPRSVRRGGGASRGRWEERQRLEELVQQAFQLAREWDPVSASEHASVDLNQWHVFTFALTMALACAAGWQGGGLSFGEVGLGEPRWATRLGAQRSDVQAAA